MNPAGILTSMLLTLITSLICVLLNETLVPRMTKRFEQRKKRGKTIDAGRLALDMERRRRSLEEYRPPPQGDFPLRTPLASGTDPPHELAVVNRLCEANRTVRSNEAGFLQKEIFDFPKPREIGREVSGACREAVIMWKIQLPKPPENKNTGDYVR